MTHTQNLYIVIHGLTCFVISQLFSVARHVGGLKLGSKRAHLYVRFSILPLSQQTNYTSSGIIRHYVVVFVCLHFCLTRYQSAQRALFYASAQHIYQFVYLSIPFFHISLSISQALYIFPYWSFSINLYIYLFIYLIFFISIHLYIPVYPYLSIYRHEINSALQFGNDLVMNTHDVCENVKRIRNPT